MGNMNFYKSENKKTQDKERWKILISDDEKDVHTLTKTVLKNYIYKNKKIEFLSAYNLYETIEIIKKNDDIALVLLDVIMTNDDDGLVAVKTIRDELKNDLIQIVLRTGQAADIPENDLVINYAINDYKEKTELTSTKLITTVTTALRSYENILELKNTKSEVNSLNYNLEKLLFSFDKSVIASKVDSLGRINYVSRAFCKIFEYSEEELLGFTHDCLRHKNQNKYVLEDIKESYEKDLEYSGKLMYVSKSGRTFWAYLKRFPEYDDKGNFLNFTNIFTDITHQVELESLNYELNALLSTFDENVISSKTDIDGNIIYASKAFCKISGYDKKELLRKNHSILRHKETKNELYEELWKTITSNKVWRGEVQDVNKNGSSFWTYSIITPEYDVNGVFMCYTSISQDITPMKRIKEAKELIETLNKEVENTQKEIIFTMGSIGEARSKETGMHVKRVAEYSKILAILCGLDEEEAEILKLASPMHDIGKIAIPDAILNKPGRLTDEEFEVMKTHSYLGYEMLKTSDRKILQVAAIVAYEHQEKYDGTGYPQGLKGEGIHIYGRITALADVFDALGSNRVYKKAWNDEKIFAMFKKERAKHFDPRLIDLFFENLDRFLEIRESLCDNI